MLSSRAFFLLFARTMIQGLYELWVLLNINSLYLVYLSQFPCASSSTGLIFHCLSGFSLRDEKRLDCSPFEIENQNLISSIPSSYNICSNSGTCCMKRSYSARVQKPITGSTTARLYQLLSKKEISPGFGRASMYRWKYHCPVCTSVGLGNATTRAVRGLRCSMKRRIVPPLPAASLPSKMITTRRPLS